LAPPECVRGHEAQQDPAEDRRRAERLGRPEDVVEQHGADHRPDERLDVDERARQLRRHLACPVA
jgi:hypothetical protein